jgi:DNA-binding response OmpR family regulator
VAVNGRGRGAPSYERKMKKKILIVDDEEDILHFLELVLREKGYDVVTAANGHDALTTAQIERPDLVLLDIMMPQMDGWEVLKLLRVDDETAHIPVAMLSARTEAKDRVQGLQEGAIDYICKPFSLQELLVKIETIFGQVGDGGKGAR